LEAESGASSSIHELSKTLAAPPRKFVNGDVPPKSGAESEGWKLWVGWRRLGTKGSEETEEPRSGSFAAIVCLRERHSDAEET
jgi:hypothetical protein